MEEIQTLTLVKGYDLYYYYYEKGEYWSGYRDAGFTTDLEEAEKYASGFSRYDALHRTNKYEETIAYQGSDGKYYKVELTPKESFAN